jgi:hypothetical protein
VNSSLAVSIFDRGTTSGHDAFKIAAITGIDSSGNPTNFGSVITIAQGWGTSNLRLSSQTPGVNPTPNAGYTVLNNTTSSNNTALTSSFRNTANVTGENIGGVLITLNDQGNRT